MTQVSAKTVLVLDLVLTHRSLNVLKIRLYKQAAKIVFKFIQFLNTYCQD